MRARARRGLVVLATVLLLAPVVAVAAAQTAPPQPPSTLTEQERLFLQAHGPVRYVIPLEQPPTVFTDTDGRVKGIVPDLLALMTVKLGIDFEVFRAANFSASVAMLANGTADLTGPITAAAEREALLDYTQPFISGRIGFWTTDRTALAGIEELAGSRVGVIRQGASARWLTEHHPGLAQVPVNETLEGVQRLRAGEFDAFLGGFAIVAYYIQRDGYADVRPLGDPVELVDAGWAVPDGDHLMLSLINKGMASIGAPERAAVFTKWTGHDLTPVSGRPPEPPFWASPLFQGVAAGSVGLVALLALWTLTLRRQVAARTRELHAREAQYRLLAEHASDVIARAGPDGRLTYVSPSVTAVLGYRPQELVGHDPLEHVHPDDVARAKETLSRLQAEDRVILLGRSRRKDGSYVWLETNASCVRDPRTGAVREVVGVSRDVTERLRAEEERGARLDHEREIRRLRELNEMKTRFLNTAAHELNTPLTPIQLQLHILQKLRGEQLSPEQVRSLGILDRNFERLRTLVQDLLDAARLQARRFTLEPEPVDLGQLVHEAVESFQDPAKQAGLRLEAEVEQGLRVRADPKRLSQVLYNLLSNAVKFTPEGGALRVRAARADGGARVEVRDTGAGVKPEDLGKLFQPFTQLDAGPRPKGGTGLGLYLSKGIVELHGGRIWCESEGQGKGATFGFVVPFEGPAAVEEPLQAEGSG